MLNKDELYELSSLVGSKKYKEREFLVELYDREHKNKVLFLEQLDRIEILTRLLEKLSIMKELKNNEATR